MGGGPGVVFQSRFPFRKEVYMWNPKGNKDLGKCKKLSIIISQKSASIIKPLFSSTPCMHWAVYIYVC